MIWTFVRAAIVWFLVCAGTGMALYPGGTRIDPGSVGYSFTQSAFSDLGRTIGLSAFFVALLPLVSNDARAAIRTVARFACLAGIVAGVAYVLVAWTPANRLPFEHVMAQNWAFRSFLVASVLLGFATVRSTLFPFRVAAGWWFFGALLLGFILIGIFGPSRRTETGLVIQVVAQKAIVFTALAIVAFQSVEAQRAARRQPAAASNASANF